MEVPSVFPSNFTLQDVFDAIEGTDEFKTSVYRDTSDNKDLIFFNYRFCTHKTFPPLAAAANAKERLLFQIKRECRGLVFRAEPGSKVDGVLEARMFHKFFNVGERDDTLPELLDLTKPHTLAVKHDGSLVAPVRFGGRVQFATKSGFSEVARQIEERFKDAEKYASWSEHWIKQGHTPLFEWCSPRNKILLDYQTDQLICLGIRDNVRGTYMPHRQLHEVCKKDGISVAELMEGGGARNANDLLSTIKSKEEIEGFVILFEESSEMFKVKTDWYFARANQKKSAEFSTSSEKSIWALVLNQQIDDASAFLDPVLRHAIERFSDVLFGAVAELARRVLSVCREHDNLNKRDFVKICASLDKLLYPQPLLYAAFDGLKAGEDVFEIVSAWAIKSCASNKGLESLRSALGGEIRFTEKVEHREEED